MAWLIWLTSPNKHADIDWVNIGISAQYHRVMSVGDMKDWELEATKQTTSYDKRKIQPEVNTGVWWFNVRSVHSWIVWKNRASVQPVQGKTNRVDSLSTSDEEKHLPSNSSWCKWDKKCIIYCFCNRFTVYKQFIMQCLQPSDSINVYLA